MPKPSDLLQGTLDLLILKTIASKPLHGWGIAKRIQTLSGDALAVGQGSLYPALHRLENQGWICAAWEESDLGRRAQGYSLTPEGRKQLVRGLKTWTRLSAAVRRSLPSARRPKTTGGGSSRLAPASLPLSAFSSKTRDWEIYADHSD